MPLSSLRMLSPLARSMVLAGPRVCARSNMSSLAVFRNQLKIAHPSVLSQIQQRCQPIRCLGSNAQYESQPMSLSSVLEREIKEETAELSQRTQSDQFPGFSVETDGADVKLTRQTEDTTVTVRFTVSSSLSEWRDSEAGNQNSTQQESDSSYTLMSLPEFQVQISRDNKTLEVSCYFEELEHDEETGEPYAMEPTFDIDELVMYEGEPRESEFAVSAEYFREELQDGLIQYMADHGIDQDFAKNLVSFATNYEKKQYIGLMQRLHNFVSK